MRYTVKLDNCCFLWFCNVLVIWIFIDGKTLCEVLTAADTIPLPMTGSRVDDGLSRHGSVRPSVQRGGNRVWSRSFGVLEPAHD